MKRLQEAASLPAITFETADLPEDVVALVDAHLLDLGGTYDVPEAGRPDRYDGTPMLAHSMPKLAQARAETGSASAPSRPPRRCPLRNFSAG